MAKLVVTMDHLQYAIDEAARTDVNESFGGRRWEDMITKDHQGAWIIIVTHFTGENNPFLRRILTAVYQPVMDARGGSLPYFDLERWRMIFSHFLCGSPSEDERARLQKIERRLMEALTSYSLDWAAMVQRLLNTLSLSLYEKIIACGLAFWLLEMVREEEIKAIGDDPFFIADKEEMPIANPDRVRRSSRGGPMKAKEMDEREVTDFDLEWDTGVSFDDIAGYHQVKEELKKVSIALHDPYLWAHWGVTPPRGLLLTGPPGNGKTQMARAMATHASLPIVEINIAKIGSFYINQTAKALGKAFDFAAQAEGCILFIDEAEVILRTRGKGGGHAEDAKVVAAFNVRMQRRADRHDGVFVVLATNMREELDEATVRAGRIDQHITVPLPDAKSRIEILELHAKKAKKMAGKDRRLFTGTISRNIVIQETSGMSCSDLEEIIRRVLHQKASEDYEGKRPGPVTPEEFIASIRNYRRERKMSGGSKIGFTAAIRG
jgi:AAA+ superfamily predicted ATPase